MARTPLGRKLRKAFAAARMKLEKPKNHGQVGKHDMKIPKRAPVSSITENKYPSKWKGDKKNNPKVVIVGAGLAGLTCAYRLKQAGISAVIYEATSRVGGRCWTKRGFFKEGQIVERGGELIDSGHTKIQALAAEIGLILDDLIEAESLGTEPFYYFDGSPYTFEEATNDFLQIYPRLQKDIEEAGYPTLYNSFTERGFKLDHTSIADYINEIVPGGLRSRFGQLLAVAYTIEYGADIKEQSSLNLLYLLGFAPGGPLQLFGESDERYHIRGGNDQLPTLLAKELEGQIRFNSELIKIEQNRQGKMRLVFRHGEKEWDVWADKVIMTIPFSILREIDYDDARFRSLKENAIEDTGMGVNTKLHAQFFNRFWRRLGNNGETFADTGYQSTWEVSRAQKGRSGILVDYTGDEKAAEQKAKTEERVERLTKRFLDKLNPVLPGSERNWNGLSTVENWLSYPWTKGSYSYFMVGQYTKFAGIAEEREGNIFFAGEHTSVDYQGCLNGAVASGERAAQEVMNDLIEEK